MFNVDSATNADTTQFLITMRDVLWLRRSLTLALLPLTIESNWSGDNQSEINTAVDYANELFESLEEYIPVTTSRTGEIVAFAGTLPSGVLACDGTAYSTATYPELFALIGYTYGGSELFFNVPDLQGRTVIGTGDGFGLTARDLADTVGTETHILASGEIPAHNHSIPARSTSAAGAQDSFMRSNNAGTSAPLNISAGGSATGHNNMQPSLALNYGIFT